MAAVKSDFCVLLESVGAERYKQELEDLHKVDTIAKFAAVPEERLKEWGLDNWRVQDAISKARELLTSHGDVVQQKQLVRAG